MCIVAFIIMSIIIIISIIIVILYKLILFILHILNYLLSTYNIALLKNINIKIIHIYIHNHTRT